MKNFLAMILIILFSIPFSYAAPHLKKTQSITIDVTLNQSINNANIVSTKNNISLTENDGWTAISGSKSTTTIKNSNQSVALMKVLQANNKHVTLQFLILN